MDLIAGRFRVALCLRAVSFLLPGLLAACSEAPTRPVTDGRPEQGRRVIERYGCVACHVIPGLPGHGAKVGPPLGNMAERGYVAGVLPNTPEAMMRWLRDPPAVDPRTAMPRLGLSEAEARDVAAYLYANH